MTVIDDSTDTRDARSEQVYVRVTPDEKGKLKQLAAVEGYDGYSPMLREEALKPLLDKHARIVSMIGAPGPS